MIMEIVKKVKLLLLRYLRLSKNVLSAYLHNHQSIGLLWALRHLHLYASTVDLSIQSKSIKHVHIYMYGSGHSLYIGKDVVYKKGTIWFEDNNGVLSIAAGTTIEEAHLAVAEDHRKIIIGEDCMLSSGIRISTTDSHSLFSLAEGKRINPARDVIIGNHVWIGNACTINKGVSVGDNSVLAGHSLLTKGIPQNVVAAGIPAGVVKTGIDWRRERI